VTLEGAAWLRPFSFRLDIRPLSGILARHFAHSSGLCFAEFFPPVMSAFSRYVAIPRPG